MPFNINTKKNKSVQEFYLELITSEKGRNIIAHTKMLGIQSIHQGKILKLPQEEHLQALD